MKRLILIPFLALVSCTLEDSVYTITTRNDCNRDENTVYTTHIVGGKTFTAVTDEVHEEEDRSCLEIEFYDVDGELVEGYFAWYSVPGRDLLKSDEYGY